MPPTEGGQLSLGFLQCFRHRRHRDTYRHQSTVCLCDEAHQFQVEYWQIHLHVMINLLLAQLAVAKQGFEGFVDNLENLLPIFFGYLLRRCVFFDSQVILLHHNFGNATQTLWHTRLFGHCHDHLYPIGIFLKTESFDMLLIVWVIVDGCHCGEFLKALNQHTFRIHIRESKRTLNVGHAFLPAPLFHSFQQCLAHFLIIHKVYPTKPHILQVPSLVCFLVDDGSHTSHYLVILICQEIRSLAEVHSRIFVRERVQHILIEIRHRIRVVLIQFIVETDKLFQLLFRLNLFDCYHDKMQIWDKGTNFFPFYLVCSLNNNDFASSECQKMTTF